VAELVKLRHAFASLLIHEGRLSVVDIAAQLGHNPTVCLDTYGHVMAEQRGTEPVSAEQEILMARGQQSTEQAGAQLSFELERSNAPQPDATRQP
jgi:hypothetical protein